MDVVVDSFCDVRPVATCWLSPVCIKNTAIGVNGDGAVVIEFPFSDILQIPDVHTM